MLEPAYRAVEDIIAVDKVSGVSFVLARRGEFITREQVAYYDLEPKAKVRTTEGPSTHRTRTRTRS